MRSILNENYFKTWTPTMAYTFGLWCADGNIYRHRPTHKWSFTIPLQEKDSYILEPIRQDMDAKFPLRYWQPPGNRQRQGILNFRSTTIGNDLIALGGTPKKSLHLKYPSVPNQFLPDFVRGVFDGDGSIIFNRNTWKAEIYGCSKDFLYGLQEDLSLNIPGLKCKVYERKRGGNRSTAYILHFSANNARRLAKFMYYELMPVFLKRKHDKFISEMGLDEPSDPRHTQRGALKTFTKQEAIALLQEGNTCASLARKYGVAFTSMHFHLYKLGIVSNNYKKHENRKTLFTRPDSV